MRILLLHALPLDERMWEPQREALWEHELLTPNLYALNGQSMDQWAMELLRTAWGELVVVGASMGGYCALAFARMAPDRVRGLVLAGSRADADSAERREDRMDTIERIERGGAEALWEKMSPLLTAAADDQLAERLREIAFSQRPDDLIKAQRAIRDRADSTDVVGAIDAPVLVVVGERDGLLPVDDAEALAKTARNGRAVVFDDAGHLPSLEQPDRFNAELLDFVGSLE
jgi:pimeloyl-ACP methyl ester carboxylesterase